MPEKFENGVLILKTHQLFSVDITPEKIENATIAVGFWFAFEKTRSGNYDHYRNVDLHYKN